MDPTDPVPDFVISIRIEHGYAIADVMATSDRDITVVMDDLHRHTRAELQRFTWSRGYRITEVRWADVETINGRVQQMTAMAELTQRTDPDWETVQAAVEADQKALAELQFLEDLARGGLT